MKERVFSLYEIAGVLRELFKLERAEVVDYIPDIGLLFEECNQLARYRAGYEFWHQNKRVVDLFCTHPMILVRSIAKWFEDKLGLRHGELTIQQSPLATYAEFFLGAIHLRVILEPNPPGFPASMMTISAIDLSDLFPTLPGRYEVESPRRHKVWIGTDPEGNLDRFWAGC